MSNVCTIDEVRQLWQLPNRKPPSITTIWRRTQSGQIPKPRRIGNINLYNRAEVIRLRNQAWGISD